MARILLADDNRQLRNILAEALTEAGHSVVEAADGKQAITQLAAQSFEVVITDMLMPEADGAEVMQMHRRLVPRPLLVVISGGGHIDPERYLAMARAMGADQVLRKPFPPSVLIAAVARLLAARPGPPG
ncbi:MAG TPA: response regulator [Planctomycetes bacterium]|nr:response regulator [Planctomycetota bacterium]